MAKLAIIGLGNPGEEYRDTRHNIGFRVVEALAPEAALWEVRGPYSMCGTRIAGRRVTLVQPLTYMNRSGTAAIGLMEDLSLDPSRLFVVSDDIHLPLGKLRVRSRGGDGGQKGLRSIIDALGDDEFARLRLGVGKPEDSADWADYVLEPFSPDEIDTVSSMIASAADCARVWVKDGVALAMDRFNR